MKITRIETTYDDGTVITESPDDFTKIVKVVSKSGDRTAWFTVSDKFIAEIHNVDAIRKMIAIVRHALDDHTVNQYPFTEDTTAEIRFMSDDEARFSFKVYYW